MRNKTLLLGASSILLAGLSIQAQSNYFQAVTNLNPVAYWPMQETSAPAPANVETNLGSLGSLANAYYVDGQGSSPVGRGITGALAGDTDPGVNFTGANNCYMAAPATLSKLALSPPFTIEMWAWPSTTTFGMPVAKTGFQGLNAAGNVGAGTGNLFGWTVDWARNGVAQWDLQLYHNAAGQGNAIQVFGPTSGAGNTAGWQHVVFTYDGTNVIFYFNGQSVATGAATYQPDFWSPLTIGAGRIANNTAGDPGWRIYNGKEDEVAIYTNLLSPSDILAHYQAGTNATPTPSYETLVLNDQPLVYYRMDAPAYTAPPLNLSPALTNYGSAATSGYYPPNTVPGGVGGPTNRGFGLTNFASPINGLNAAPDGGYASQLNPPTGQPLTATIWVKGDPTDGRFQAPMSHSDSSWRFGWDSSGKAHWNAGAGGEITSVKVVNDGNWHFLAGVYTGTQNLLYIDGVLDTITNATGAIVGSTNDVFIGGAPDYVTSANERFFAGSVCQAAIFTNALTAAQILQLYGAAGIAPQITKQPVSATANQGAFYTNSVVAIGTAPLFYQWYQNSFPVPGQTNATLVFNPLSGAEAGTYDVVITNQYGSVTSTNVVLTVIQTPVFTKDLTNQTQTNNILLFAGAHPTFSIAAVGAIPLSYSWLTNNVVVGGATSANYTLPPVQMNGVTSIAAVVNNSLGSVTSTVVSVTVLADPPEPYPQSVVAANPIGYWRLNEGPDNGTGNDGVIADDYWGADNGVYTNVILDQTGNSYDPATDPESTGAEFGYLTFTDADVFNIGGIDFSSPSNTSAAFSIEAWINAYPQTKSAGIVTKGYGNGGEQFCLDTGANNGTQYAFRFFVRTAAGVALTANSTVLPDSLWHHLVGVCDEPDGVINLYIDGNLAAKTSVAPGSGILAATNLMIIGSRSSSGTVGSNDLQLVGTVSDVAVYNYALSASQEAAQYYSAGIAPAIVQQPPATVNVDENGSITIPATAGGTPPLSYQWFNLNTGLPVAGQTNATLVLTDVPLSLNGSSFQLTVSNQYNVANSTPVTLNVLSGIPQTSSPALPPQVFVYSNSIYTYHTPAVTGTEPISFQWYNGSAPIAGATNSSYSLLAVSNTIISVSISNVDGAITSNPSAVTLITAPTNAYAQAVLGLNPVAYWPMQETNPPAAPNIETNFGSLGAAANAYYLDNANAPVGRGIPGAIAGDSDAAVSFSGGNNCYLGAPAIDPRMALTPPFTIELWASPANTTFGMPLAKNGFNGLNAGGFVGSGLGNLCGWSVDWARNGVAQWDLQLYDNIPAQGAAIQIFGPTSSAAAGVWQHVVFTYDGTNVNFYWNGQLASTGKAPYVPDTWSPLTVGGGRLAQGTPGNQGYRLYAGSEDEVALYTNILSTNDILAHYQAGSGATSGTPYETLVLNDRPLVYYRLDAPAYTAPAAATYPPLINYGSTPTVGDYPPNTIPGEVAGPSSLGNGQVASPINGLNAAVDAGFAPELNPSGGQPITATIWVRGYPSDGRMQCPMGHSDQSWRFGWDSNGKAHWASGDNAAAITSVKTVNDGNWHFLAGVYTGTQNLLYIDGVLDSSEAATGSITGSADDVYLGGAPDYTGATNEEFFAGSICQAAFFTNALTFTQIQQLYLSGADSGSSLNIGRSGGSVVLTWSGGTLVSSTSVAGPFTTNAVAGATSPYTITPSETARFYQVRIP